MLWDIGTSELFIISSDVFGNLRKYSVILGNPGTPRKSHGFVGSENLGRFIHTATKDTKYIIAASLPSCYVVTKQTMQLEYY